MDKEYVQYSKKVTKWAMFLVTFVMIACLLVVAFLDVPQYNINAVVSLFTTFQTVLGITIGAYQGNSTLEKYSKAKYQFESIVAAKESQTDAIGDDGDNG